MLRSLINGKFELVPRCPFMRNMICEPIWFCIRYNECIQNDPCRENEILAYMLTSLINGKVELVPWFKIWYVNLFGFVFGKMRVLEWPLSWKFMNVELVPWCETWYLNLYGCKFGKMKVLKWPLSRKRDFGLNSYKFDKWEGWTCPLIKYDMCNYFLLNSVNWKCWNDSWRENGILA